MKADKENAIKRFIILMALIAVFGLYVIGTALKTMLPPEKLYWEAVEKRFTKEAIPIPPKRGMILSDDGQVLTASVPEYKLYMDFRVMDPDSITQAKAQAWRDSAFAADLDSISLGLARIFPDRTAEWFKDRLQKGKKRNGFSYRIYPRNATYIQYKQVKELPLFRESSFKGGFHAEEVIQRVKPFGGLVSRTVGDLYKDTDAAKMGLELTYDTILRGKPGVSHRTKVRNARLSFVDIEPEDGHDIQTTIDVNIQDVADRSLRHKLEEVNGEIGIAMVMEVKTGDVKAIVNLTRGQDGQYYEMKNNAVSDLMEPGSTFKTASIMVALEDGFITKDTRIDTGNGIYPMYGRHMKDHNWRKGGYGELTVTEILCYSSNIGVSRLIDKFYHEDPDRYVRGLYRLGVGLPLHLPFVGAGEPRVRHPKKQGRYWTNWSNTALPWMSIGYETVLPPVSTLAFYNGIANGGKMVKPRFVKAEMKDGHVLREFPVEVVKEKMCSDKTLSTIQEILEKVVSEGLGKKAANNGHRFKVSGKTGTAQIASTGGRGYHTGITRYMVSFCGYFPSEAPKYSCLVCIVKTGLPASGGGQCGPVFSEISQYIMSKGMYRSAEEASDSNSVYVPHVSGSDRTETRELLDMMGVGNEGVDMHRPDTVPDHLMPDLRGMGARSAVYELRQRGLRVIVHGKGYVTHQNVAPGSEIRRGSTITLTLSDDPHTLHRP